MTSALLDHVHAVRGGDRAAFRALVEALVEPLHAALQVRLTSLDSPARPSFETPARIFERGLAPDDTGYDGKVARVHLPVGTRWRVDVLHPAVEGLSQDVYVGAGDTTVELKVCVVR